MRAVVSTAVGLATLLYLLVSYAAYARFGQRIHGDILLNLAAVDSAGVRIVRLAFGLSLCLTYPCLHYAARRALDQLLFSRRGATGRDSSEHDRQAGARAKDYSREAPQLADATARISRRRLTTCRYTFGRARKFRFQNRCMRPLCALHPFFSCVGI